MNRDKAEDQDLPNRDPKEIEEQARESRKQLDEVPEHGSDPLHDGP